MSERIEIHGHVEDGFGPVADAFRRNFERHGEIGAALSVYRADKPVIDIWAGYRDRARTVAWERDTLVPVFSSTKGMAAFTVAAAVSAGLLSYEEKVAHYWPEFAAHGKGDVTVADLLDHRAGLAALDVPLKIEDLHDLDALAVVLAEQKPAWKPGTRHGYHAITLGLYEGELVRRVDPAHRSLGRYFAEEIAAPLGLDFYIGLPDDVSMDRIATLSSTGGLDVLRYERDLSPRMGLGLLDKRSLSFKALSNPRVGKPARAARRKFLAPEMAGSNGVGTARSLARTYGAAAGTTGELPIRADILARLGETVDRVVPGADLVLHTDSRYHLGFRKSHKGFPFGSPDHRAYGTTGLGGSFGFADPTTQLGYGYTPNRLGLAVLDDIRSRNLRNALMRTVS